MTYTELERAAYISGNTVLADAYAALERAETLEETLDAGGIDVSLDLSPQIDDIQAKAIKDNCPDYEAYKQFFFDCFARLDAHYPCPEVTSDYDQSVIFDAIENGGIE